MRALFVVFIMVFSSSNLMASDYCFEKYGLEIDREELKYQYAVSNANVSKELSFRSGKTVLSVLVFEERSSKDEVTQEFELLMASAHQASELVQINPHKLTKSYNFAKKLVFPKQQNIQRHDSYLLFSENGCNLIFKQNIMATTNTKSAVSGLINKAKLFSKLQF